MSQSPTDNPIELLCPECGYDLRATESERCPECGANFDRATLGRSRIPWMTRKSILDVRAYARTVWHATVRPVALADEVATRRGLQEARRFRLVTVCIASAIPVAAIIVLLDRAGGTAAVLDLNLDPQSPLANESGADFVVPWLAGALFWPVWPASILLFAYLASTIASYWFAPRSLPIPRQHAAIMVSRYLCAPLAWLVIPFAIIVIAGLLANSGWASKRVLFSLTASQSIICAVLILAVWFDIWLNTLRLLRRMVDASRRRVLSAAIGIPIAWMLCVAIAFAVMPWLIGFIWLMIDSPRR